MKTNAITLSLALIALCGFAASSTLAGDQEDIQGYWTLQKVTMNGQDVPAPVVTYFFAGDTLTIHPEAGVEKKSTFKLEGSKSKVIVMEHNEPGTESKPTRSPYELNGDTLKIAFGAVSLEASEKGQILFTLQRKKKS